MSAKLFLKQINLFIKKIKLAWLPYYVLNICFILKCDYDVLQIMRVYEVRT